MVTYLLREMKHFGNIQHVTSLDLPGLQPYRTLRRPLDHIRAGIFVAEGAKVVQRLLESDLTILSLLLTPQWYEQLLAHDELSPETKANQPTIFIAEKELLETIVGFNLHQGIMAVANVPKERSLDDTVSTLSVPFLLVALDGLVNAENVGVVVRNCAGLGVDAVIAGETSSSPYLRRAVRNSMGTAFSLPVIHSINLRETLLSLRQNYGTRIVGAHPHGELPIEQSDLTGNVCIVFGNEGEGISSPILDACTDRVHIPMMNETDSLNVASASAVFLHEARRQRMRHSV